MQGYRLLQSDTSGGLEKMVLKALNEDGMSLLGGPMELAGRKVQAIVSGATEQPAELMTRIASAELKAAEATLKAAEAKGSAETATSSLASIALEFSGKADIVGGKVPYDQLPEFPVGRKVNVANKAARLALTDYTDLTIAYESDTGDAWGLDANADASVEGNWSRLGNAQAVGVSSFNGRTGNVGPQAGDYDASKISETLTRRYVTTEQITAWDAKPGPQEISEAISLALAGSDLPLETKQHAADTYLAKASRGVASGVAPLGADSKVPAANLPTVDLSGLIPLAQKGAASGVAPLGTDKKVPAVNLPDVVLPRRIYRNALATKTLGFWYKNETTQEVEVFARTAIANNAGTLTFVVSPINGTTGGFTFISDGVQNAASLLGLQVIVPPGWWYRLTLGADRALSSWIELSQE